MYFKFCANTHHAIDNDLAVVGIYYFLYKIQTKSKPRYIMYVPGGYPVKFFKEEFDILSFYANTIVFY